MTLSIFVAALAAPAGADMTTGMGTMQYYVGRWSCPGGTVGQPPARATSTYTLDSGVLRQWVVVPTQGKMKRPYTLSTSMTYDAKDRRYVSDGVDNNAGWWVSFAKPWTGNTEQWTDHATNDNKLGHAQVVRTNKNSFSYTGYPTLNGTKPNFKVTCTRSP